MTPILFKSERGALLLEAMLALAVFVMAGAAVLSLMRQAATGLERSRDTQRAADYARSAMAKIEAGIETTRTLHGPVRPWLREEAERGGSVGGSDEVAPSGWELEIDNEPSEFTGLTRVTVTALKRAAGGGEPTVSYTLRQLVRLSGKGEDTPGAEDELVEIAREAAPESAP